MINPQLAKQKEEELKKQKEDAIKKEIKEVSRSEEITAEYIEDEKTFRRGIVSIRDLISPASFKVNPDYLRLGGKYVRTMFVINYPRYISVGWFAPIINLNSTFDVSMFFYPVKSSII